MICIQCHNEILDKKRNKFCNTTCYRNYHRYSLICQNPQCQKILIDNQSSKFCSQRCAKKITNINRNLGRVRTNTDKKKISDTLALKYSSGQLQHWTSLRQDARKIIDKKSKKHSLSLRKSYQSGKVLHISKTNPQKWELSKDKIRAARLRQIERDGIAGLQLGRNEKTILDQKEAELNIVIERQYKISELGYIVDGYCKDKNIVFEIYEKRHKWKKNKERDALRESKIKKLLNCDFVVIWDIAG